MLHQSLIRNSGAKSVQQVTTRGSLCRQFKPQFSNSDSLLKVTFMKFFQLFCILYLLLWSLCMYTIIDSMLMEKLLPTIYRRSFAASSNSILYFSHLILTSEYSCNKWHRGIFILRAINHRWSSEGETIHSFRCSTLDKCSVVVIQTLHNDQANNDHINIKILI